MIDTLDHTTAILRRHLESEWKGEKKPKGVDKALEETRSNKQAVSAKDYTQQIFLSVGLQAWFAYFLANHGRGSHYQGQAAETKTIRAFDQLPEDQRRGVANDIEQVKAHNSIAAVIKGLSMPPAKRRRVTTDDSSEPQSFVTSLPGQPWPVESSLNAEYDNANTELRSAIPAELSRRQPTVLSSTVTPPPQRQHETFWATASSTAAADSTSTTVSDPVQQQQTVSNPPMAHTANVFPDYMCTAIKRDGDRAVLTMAFPYTLEVVCLMSLAIRPNKVEYIAMVLFGVHIEVEDGLRWLILGNGARCMISSDAPLQGARFDGIKTLLGLDVAHAITTSPARPEELKQALVATRCVTLSIDRDPAEGGVLNLNLGTEGGHKIKGKLFPR